MASSRNKNTSGNYALEQYSYNKQSDYSTYLNSSSGQAHLNHFAGNGLLMGKRPHTELSYNPTEVEGILFGIGSSNLVNPITPPVVQIKRLDSLDICNRTPVIIPTPFVMEPGQRPSLW